MACITVYDTSYERRVWYARALEGHDVTVVASLEDAVQLLATTRTDLLIAEWFESDGPKLITRIKQVQGLVLPTIVLTADVRTTDEAVVERHIVNAIGHDAHWFLAYPMSQQRFREEVASVLVEFGLPIMQEVPGNGAMPIVRGTLEILPMSATGRELASDLLQIREAALMIDQTVGPDMLCRQLEACVAIEDVQTAQQTAIALCEWSQEPNVPQLLQASHWSVLLGHRQRTASQELLFRVAQGILFPPH